MWKDPIDVTKRKPRRLRGTPANRFANIVAVSVVGVFCLVCNWYASTDLEWVQRARMRVLKRVERTEKEDVRREMFHDVLFASTINLLNEKDNPKFYPTNDDED